MEKESDIQPFMPLPDLVVSAHRALGKTSAVPFFRQPDTLDGCVRRFLDIAIRNIEMFTGKLYAFPTFSYISTEWKDLLQYLYTEGIITDPIVKFVFPYNDEPKFFILHLPTELESTSLVNGAAPQGTFHNGFSFDFEEALTKVVGELLERSLLLPLKIYSYTCASVAFLEGRRRLFVRPDLLSAYSNEQQEQYGHFRLKSSDEFLWVEGKEFGTGQRILIPAQVACWGYRADDAGEPILRESNSNGCAGMTTLDGAILAGLSELIEREGFLMYWLNTVPPPRIDPTSIDDKGVQDILKKIERYDFRVEILDVTTDIGLPAFAAILIDHRSNRCMTAGGGAGSNPAAAIKKALVEALFLRYMGKEDTIFPRLDESYITFGGSAIDQYSRALLWMNKDMYSRFQWFIDGPHVNYADRKKFYSVPGNPTSCLAYVTNRFREWGDDYKLYYFEPMHPVLRMLNYHAVKVIVPALVPFYLREKFAGFRSKRLQEVPRRMGFLNPVFPNPLPHPVP